jgi:hypothetical protein
MLPVPGGDDPVKKSRIFYFERLHFFSSLLIHTVSSDTDAVYSMNLSFDSDAVYNLTVLSDADAI